MNSKVHEAVGMATTLAVMHPNKLEALVLGVPLILIGSIIPDIDCNSDSKTKQYFRKTVLWCVIIALIAIFINLGVMKITGVNVRGHLNHNILVKLIGFAIFMCICGFGYNRPHREFTHSFVGVVIFTVPVMLMVGFKMSLYFMFAMLSHVLIDLLNTKGESLLFPLKNKYCFNVCKASSTTSNYIGAAASIITIMELYLIAI